MIRCAACNCGQLRIASEGEPVRVSMCHCLECQRPTGAVFVNQAWFELQQITVISGSTTEFTPRPDFGHSVAFRFCPICGSTVYWEAEGFPNLIAVAVGSFADSAGGLATLSPIARGVARLFGSVLRVPGPIHLPIGN